MLMISLTVCEKSAIGLVGNVSKHDGGNSCKAKQHITKYMLIIVIIIQQDHHQSNTISASV